jgi:hypothetical protein
MERGCVGCHDVERALPATAWPLRAARAGAVALAAVGTSVTGHAMAGGPVPAPTPLAAFTLAVAALVVPLSRLRWTPIRLLGVLAVAQGGFHLGFAGLTGSASGASDLRMAAWHLAATVVTCALVLHAEAWLWRVLRGRTVQGRPALLPSTSTSGPTARVGVPQGTKPGRGVSRRGPPLPASA